MVLARYSRGFHASAIQHSSAKVAVLYQAVSAPIINGVTKPLKRGGYRDSGADIAYALRKHKVASIITPSDIPDPKSDQDWCFPDDEKGLLAALSKGANILWANTTLFSKHPLQIASSLDKYADQVKIVGQAPRAVEAYDDKAFTNDLLRRDGRFLLPKSWILNFEQDYSALLKTLDYPIVAKPIRGRGSHGVKLCHDCAQLENHMAALFSESSQIMLEQYLAGEEATVTVMPPLPQQHKQETIDILPNIGQFIVGLLMPTMRFRFQIIDLVLYRFFKVLGVPHRGSLQSTRWHSSLQWHSTRHPKFTLHHIVGFQL
jgi:hypothetical protein